MRGFQAGDPRIPFGRVDEHGQRSPRADKFQIALHRFGRRGDYVERHLDAMAFGETIDALDFFCRARFIKVSRKGVRHDGMFVVKNTANQKACGGAQCAADGGTTDCKCLILPTPTPMLKIDCCERTEEEQEETRPVCL